MKTSYKNILNDKTVEIICKYSKIYIIICDYISAICIVI